jgi:hypothetical protein
MVLKAPTAPFYMDVLMLCSFYSSAPRTWSTRGVRSGSATKTVAYLSKIFVTPPSHLVAPYEQALS